MLWRFRYSKNFVLHTVCVFGTLQ